MACTHISMCKSDNTVKLNMILKRFFQMLHMQMKFTHVMIVQIIQEQSLGYNPLQVLYYAQMSPLRNLVDLLPGNNFVEINIKTHRRYLQKHFIENNFSKDFSPPKCE